MMKQRKNLPYLQQEKLYKLMTVMIVIVMAREANPQCLPSSQKKVWRKITAAVAQNPLMKRRSHAGKDQRKHRLHMTLNVLTETRCHQAAQNSNFLFLSLCIVHSRSCYWGRLRQSDFLKIMGISRKNEPTGVILVSLITIASSGFNVWLRSCSCKQFQSEASIFPHKLHSKLLSTHNEVVW